MKLERLLARILPPDETAMEQAKRRLDSIAKPLGSLGQLETALIRIAGLTGSADISLEKRCAVVFCADNGVVAQGVAQTGSEVTAVVAQNIAQGKASVCLMGRMAGCDVLAVDVGMAQDVRCGGLQVHKVANGTRDMSRGPAMTRAQVLQALFIGAKLAEERKSQGYHILAAGEMGIGNTTTSAAVVSVLLGLAPKTVTGRGSGLSSEGLARKIKVIERAIDINRPDSQDVLDVLAKVGGFDIAALCGLFLGGAAHGIPVLLDGFISAAAALAAVRLCSQAKSSMIASHLSAEPGARLVLDALELTPLICADMRLGEGTGAVAALPLLDMACAVYNEMHTFDELGIESYKPLN